MDLATILGLIISFALVITAVILGGGSGPVAQIMTFIDIPSMFIVFGGTLGATLASSPMQNIIGLGGVLKHAFLVKPINTNVIINEFMDYANRARREGILALESAVRAIPDPYLRKGLQLTVDGLEPDIIEGVLEAEIENMEARHNSSLELINAFASFAPALGMIGTVIGLVKMLKTLDDPSTIGPAMAIALITTFYGVILANLIFLPIGNKLKIRSQEEVHLREMQMEGILGIARGENPRLIREKLNSYLPPQDRKEA